MSSTTPEIILWTSHACPWAHRAHIALHALGLPYKEVLIDLSVPRPAWYLDINPRGQVPTLSYNGEILFESGVIAQFLLDAHPSHLLPASNATGAALTRARMALFIDAAIGKVVPQVFKLYGRGRTYANEAEKEEEGDNLVALIKKEIEPHLGETGFFGGAEKITLVEVQTGSFILRLLDFGPQYGMMPQKTLDTLQKEAPKFWGWANRVKADENVNFIWKPEIFGPQMKAKIDAAAQAAKAGAK